MRGEKTLLSDFPWRVVVDGHRVIKARPVGEKPETKPVDHLTDGVVPGAQYRYRRYFPMREHTALFKKFADTALTPEAIIAFADEFGMLGGSVQVQIPLPNSLAADPARRSDPGSSIANGEALRTWQAEILAMREAVYLWDLVFRRDLAVLARHITWTEQHILYDSIPDPEPRTQPGKVLSRAVHSIPRDVTAPDGQLRFEEGDVVQPALYRLQHMVNERLAANTASRLLWEPESGALVLYTVPVGLLGAMWLQLAETISNNQYLKACEVCGTWFRVASGIGRTDKKYCSDRCRTAAFRRARAPADRGGKPKRRDPGDRAGG